MNVAIILAGGSGTRMNSSKLPKQFIEVSGKPIIIHTVEKFYFHKDIDKIIIACKEDWIEECKTLLNKHKINKNVDIIPGGGSRNESIKNSVFFAKKKYKLSNKDILITHDAVRPFVSNKIISENIFESRKNNVIVDTCVKAIDTIVCSDGNIIKNIPDRNELYLGQTPQSGNFKLIEEIYLDNYEEYLFTTTDLCRLAIEKNIPMNIVNGDYYNIKITTTFDLYLAKIIGEKNE